MSDIDENIPKEEAPKLDLEHAGKILPIKEYKIKVDKHLVRQFLLDAKVTKEELKEIDKVINIILIKYNSKYSYLFTELKQYALLAILMKKARFDPTKDAYNYIYTICRNEIGNTVLKLTKETFADDIKSYNESLIEWNVAELPEEVERYRTKLIGAEDFKSVRIPKKDILPLILFLRMHESRRAVQLPSFLEETKTSVLILYKLLKELVEDE